jgi:dihydrofolate synthase/folylpolyglutamate synthase
MTYAEAVGRLLALRGGEIAGMRPGLERIEALLAVLGHPEQRFRIVQVGGTNGKGSISAMLASIFTTAGLSTGLYTSPHLCSFRERIRVNGRAIPEADVVDGVEAIGTLVARLDASVFEATTALALDHFARESVEIAVLEVGLGGRLDSTTVGRPEAEVLGRIDMDHQALLGDTLTAIAAEKAAIIRSGVALSARQEPEVDAVLAARAREVGVRLLREGRELTASVRSFSLHGQRLDLAGPDWALEDVVCPLLGIFQPGNALLAVATARCLGIGAEPIRGGLGAVRWPGRFQVLQERPTLILDGAHNPAGARALAASLGQYFPGQPVTFVIAILADKDQAGILEALVPLAERVITTSVGGPRAARPEALALLLASRAAPIARGVQVAATPAEALDMALTPPTSPVICVAGSLRLLGEILAVRGQSLEILCGTRATG